MQSLETAVLDAQLDKVGMVLLVIALTVMLDMVAAKFALLAPYQTHTRPAAFVLILIKFSTLINSFVFLAQANQSQIQL